MTSKALDPCDGTGGVWIGNLTTSYEAPTCHCLYRIRAALNDSALPVALGGMITGAVYGDHDCHGTKHGSCEEKESWNLLASCNTDGQLMGMLGEARGRDLYGFGGSTSAQTHLAATGASIAEAGASFSAELWRPRP